MKLGLSTYRSVLPLILVLAAAFSAPAPASPGADGDPATRSGDRGVVDFTVSCTEAVQEDFDQALALLHHMMYEQAREEFQRISERAPDCAMAYWGVAMTRFQPLWSTRPDSEALAAGHREVRDAMELQDTLISAFHLAVMPARHAVERRDWKSAARIEPREPPALSWDDYPWPEAIAWLAKGLGSVHTGALDEARAVERRMAALKSGASEAGDEALAVYIEIDRRILGGFIAHAGGDDETAVDLLRSAAELEATVEKHPVTPGALVPPYEALGDLLLELERAVEALEAYESSLDVWPGRYRSLLGAARAAAAAERREVAREHYADLLRIAGEPAEPRPGLLEAQRYVSDNELGRR